MAILNGKIQEAKVDFFQFHRKRDGRRALSNKVQRYPTKSLLDNAALFTVALSNKEISTVALSNKEISTVALSNKGFSTVALSNKNEKRHN